MNGSCQEKMRHKMIIAKRNRDYFLTLPDCVVQEVVFVFPTKKILHLAKSNEYILFPAKYKMKYVKGVISLTGGLFIFRFIHKPKGGISQ